MKSWVQKALTPDKKGEGLIERLWLPLALCLLSFSSSLYFQFCILLKFIVSHSCDQPTQISATSSTAPSYGPAYST